MKVVQLVSNLAYGSAIGNEVVMFHRELIRNQVESWVAAPNYSESMAAEVGLHGMEALDHLAAEDVLIFHKASGDILTSAFLKAGGKKVLRYHNITPGRYFFPYDQLRALNQWQGRRQLKKLVRERLWAWCVSQYNGQELLDMGLSPDRVRVFPILMEKRQQWTQPDPEILRKYGNGSGLRMIFVGRIVPNKRFEDVIRVYALYLREYDPRAQLFLVGSWEGHEKYYAKLRGLCADLKLDRVVFTGRVSDAEKEAYYSISDLLVCMSEHEGFCIPLIEAMEHDLPVVARAASAVPETLGQAGVLIQGRDWKTMVERIHALRSDSGAKDDLVRAQKEWCRRYAYEQVKEQFGKNLREVMEAE